MALLKVRRIGNTLGVTLPRDTVRALKIAEGDLLSLTEGTDGAFRLTAYDPGFSDSMNAAESFMARYRHALRALAK